MVLAAALLLSSGAVATPAGATANSVDWAGACEEAILLIPTDYDQVAPLVPPPFRETIVHTGVPGADQAVLIFTFNRCDDSTVTSHAGRFSTARAAEVIAGVVILSDYTDDTLQFYSLASYVNWEPLATGFKSLGLPTVYVPAMQLDIAIDALTQTGGLHVTVPAPGELLSGSVDFVAANREGLPARATQFAVGPRGIVRVVHDSPLHAITPVALGTVTTDRPDGTVGTAMSRAHRDGIGMFFDKGQGHHHTATVDS